MYDLKFLSPSRNKRCVNSGISRYQPLVHRAQEQEQTAKAPVVDDSQDHFNLW